MSGRSPCPTCGASRGLSTRLDGSTFCFKCQENTPAPGGVSAGTPKAPKGGGKGKAKFLEVEITELPARALRADTCEKWGYGVSTFKGKPVQVAQYRDAAGRLCGQKLRFAGKGFVIVGDLKPAGLFGEHLWRDGGKFVVVTEGEIDALSVSQLQGNKWPVVSLPNGAQSAKKALAASAEWLAGFEHVVVMFDNDEAGQAAAIEAAEALPPGKVKIARLPLKDANDMLVAGRGAEVVDAIWGAKVYRPDALITGKDIWQMILKEDVAASIPIFHKGLQAKLRGWRAGEVTVLTGGTGTGKSSVCREIAADILLQGERLGYVGLEEDVRQSALGILSIYTNQRLCLMRNSEFVTPDMEKLQASFEDRVVFYDNRWQSLDSDALLSKIRYMAQGIGVKFIVLDHLSIVASGLALDVDERRSLDLAMTSVAQMAKQLNIHIFLVVHLKRVDDKPHESGRAVSLQDLRGTQAISQLAWNVLSLERDQQGEDSDMLTIRVLKNRTVGDLGVAGQLRWNPETGRLTEHVNGFKDETVEGGDAFEGDKEVPGLPGDDQPEVQAVRQAVPRVRAAPAQGKVERAVEEHGLSAVGASDRGFP